MTINSFPINTITPAANLITNTPFGIISATDVQAALNQLASAIPSPGPGTDPLFLIHGISVNADNPTLSANQNDRWAGKVLLTTDCSQTRPTFANNTAWQMETIATNGQNTNTGGNQTKQTFFAAAMTGIYNAAGQKFVQSNNIQAFGMGDSAIHGNNYVLYSGGPVNGDEGQGWGLVSNLQQQNYLNVTSITSVPTQSVVNTTTTQAITASKDAQTVNVVSTAGAVNGDWVVIDQQVASGQPTLEAVQIISFTATSITGVFVFSHINGVTVTPALVLNCISTFQMGQDRVLINLTKPAYTTGTISAIVGGGMDGLGTTWTNNMVGGNAKNIGVISLTADDYSGAPFDGTLDHGTLKAWYQIIQITAPTHLAIHSFTTGGDTSYQGKGPGAGTYTIRQSAKVLRIDASAGSVSGKIICETSTSTWSAGDTVEQVICPYADVSGFQWSMAHYTTGGAGQRRFLRISNDGVRTIESCFEISQSSALTQPGADPIAFNSIFSMNATCSVGMNFNASGGYRATGAAIFMPTAGFGGSVTDTSGLIAWNQIGLDSGMQIRPDTTNGAMKIITSQSGISPNPYGSVLQFALPSKPANPDPNIPVMLWGGYFWLPVSGTNKGYIVIDNLTGAVNFERSFQRWEGNVFAIGTEKGGAGGDRDMILKTANTERLRFPAGGGIKFTDAADFSANGAVATAITAVGPTGAATTVQKWLTIVDNTGATRYIPCF